MNGDIGYFIDPAEDNIQDITDFWFKPKTVDEKLAHLANDEDVLQEEKYED